jgi:hypothetical protein
MRNSRYKFVFPTSSASVNHPPETISPFPVTLKPITKTKMPYTWDDAGGRKLLLAVIHLTMPAAPKWDQVATLLGDGCTGEGARYVSAVHCN